VLSFGEWDMLYLTRKLGQSVVINNQVEVTVVEVSGKTVKLGFTFPPEASVLRKEIYDKISAENMAASQPLALDAVLGERGDEA
jgi:carbon storage regulator